MYSGFEDFRRTARRDLKKAFLLTYELDLKELEAELENEFYSKLDKETSRASKIKMYLIPGLEADLIPGRKGEIVRRKMNVSALLIRGSVDVDHPVPAQMQVGRILQKGLEKLNKKHGDRIRWLYEEAKSLDTRKFMNEYDQDLAKREFLT